MWKEKKCKKIVSLMLAMVMTLALIPISARAASETMDIGGQTYSLSDNANGTGWAWNANSDTLWIHSRIYLY